MKPATFINGIPGDTIQVQDRGLQYGDGLFETLAVRKGVPQLWGLHMERLLEGCRRLRLPAPDPSVLRSESDQLCAGRERALLKIIVTRGPGARGYRIERQGGTDSGGPPTRIVSVYAAQNFPAGFYRDGVAIRLCTLRLGCNPALAGIKHLSRLEQVLARDEWIDPDIAEGLMCDRHGNVVEGTMSNVFMVKSGVISTPALVECGVAGVMRRVVIERIRATGWRLEARVIDSAEIKSADELFLCNSLIGIWPVRRIDETEVRPGPVTAHLAAAVGGYSLMPEISTGAAASDGNIA